VKTSLLKADLVLLHGWASRPGDLLPLAEALSELLPDSQKRLLLGGVRIETATQTSFAWWNDDDATLESLEPVFEKLATSSNKPVVLIGFSQGAALAMATAVHRPDRVAAVVSIGGFVLDGLNIAKLECPLLILHGESDERVDSMHAERLQRQATKAGVDSTISLFDGGHFIPLSAAVTISEWLASRS
jgi:predicted esterase